MKLIDGKRISLELKNKLKEKVKLYDVPPELVVVTVGDDPASKVYVNQKEKMATEIGLIYRHISLETCTQDKLVKIIKDLNSSSAAGIIVQLPIPGISEDIIAQTIDPKKDVDGFNPTNIGLMVRGQECLKPCTPAGIIHLLNPLTTYSGLHAVVVGRSNIVGKPISSELINKGCTVTTCNSRTQNLKEIIQTADILVSAIGKPHFIKSSWIKPGAIVIDVGITRENNKLKGDCELSNNASYQTPVPGGVGPMTVVKLMENVCLAYDKNLRNS